MRVFLGLVGILAALSAGFAFLELMATWKPDATVFQQIAARVSLGLSLIVMVCAFGFAALIVAAPAAPEAPRAAAVGSGTPVAKHQGAHIYRDGNGYVANFGGKVIRASQIDRLKQELDHIAATG